MAKKLVIFISILLVCVTLINAQILPARIKNRLNKSYSGWKLAPTSNSCSEEYRNNIISEDFDGDKKKDFAIKFTKGKKGYILAFLDRKNDYQVLPLESMTDKELKDTGMALILKGEEVGIDSNYDEDTKWIRLKNNGVRVAPCASDNIGTYVYRSGKFIDIGINFTQ